MKYVEVLEKAFEGFFCRVIIKGTISPWYRFNDDGHWVVWNTDDDSCGMGWIKEEYQLNTWECKPPMKEKVKPVLSILSMNEILEEVENGTYTYDDLLTLSHGTRCDILDHLNPRQYQVMGGINATDDEYEQSLEDTLYHFR